MLHEIAHLYYKENDIKDVSRGGIYHNKKFKTVINKIARGSVFTISRNNNMLNAVQEGSEKKKSSIKYGCNEIL